MLPIAYYLLKVIICSGILYGYYWLLLRNKVFHKYNRFYLMAAVVLSLLLPLIKINFWQQNTDQQSSVIRVLQVVSSGDEYMDNVIVTANSDSFDAQQLPAFGYLAVSLVFFLIFIHTLYRIFCLLKKYPKQIIDTISFINTDAKSTPFSFLNYIFWNYNIDRETTTGNQIFKHELAHVQEKHTHDKLFINIILIFFWCNPFYWLYRKELNMIHEFIADKKAVEDSDTEAFAAMILQATYPQHRFQLTNNFFYSPVKRRLMMLIKNKNPRVNYFGRIMVLPLAVLVFAAFTFKTKTGLEAEASRYNGKKIVVVISPGHGGKDGGAKSKDGILEKDITLAIAKEIKALNTNDNIDIVLTREDDRFLDVHQKSAIAKEYNAAMYIAVHTGATATPEEKEYHLGDPMDNESGLKIIIGKDSFPFSEQNKLLGSAILNEFSNNYPLPVPQQLVNRRLYTTENSPCPSVYIEAGLMTNTKDLAYLQSEAGKETIAKNILAAINKFAIANLQVNASPAAILNTSNFTSSHYVKTQSTDTNYYKTDAYKSKALIIIDGKEIGNLGYNYVEASNNSFSSVVFYNPDEAQKLYGEKGRYGAIKLTSKNVACTTTDSVFIDPKDNSIRIPGNNSVVKSDIKNSLVYVDGKISTVEELQAIAPEKISSVNILKVDPLTAVADDKGKNSIIKVTLKPVPPTEITMAGVKPQPLYVVDNIVEVPTYKLSSVLPDNIQKIDVLKDETAIAKYGEKGKNGVVEITTKKNAPLALQEIKVSGYQVQMGPSFSVGRILGTRAVADEFKKQTEIKITEGYKFESADVYFSGEGFKNVVMVHLSGSSLSPLREYLDRCVPGTVVTFDNVHVNTPKDGIRVIDGKSYSLIAKDEKVIIKNENGITVMSYGYLVQ